MQADRVDAASTGRKKKWMSRRRGACEMCKSKKLHNLKCEYNLSKKQQANNKPAVDEVSIDPSLTESSSSGATTLVPSPTDIQILPDLTATQLGAAHRVSGNAGNALQEMMFATNGRHDMPVMFDGYAHDDFSATSMEWIGSDTLGAPFSVDMSNMNGLGMLPWSPPKTAHSDANFDMPYALEHTTDAAAQFELNLPLSPEGSMRDIYDEKMWEEVGSKRLGNLSRTQQDEVDGIFRRLSDAQSQISCGLAGEQYDGNHSRWYWSDTALIEKCKAACFDDPLGISTFLTRSHFENYVQQARDSPSIEGLAVRPLVDSVMALGFQALAARSLPSVGSDVSRKAIARLRMALSSHDAVQRSPDSLLKMQMTIAEQIDHTIYTELLSYAVSCARTRRFMNRDSTYMTMTKEKEYLARRSLWYLYSIEVVHSIRDGMPPILTRDWTDYALPETSKETDWLLIQYQHANALSSAVNTLYSPKALCQTLAERERNLMQAHKVLENWRTGLPSHLQNIHRHETGYVTLDDQKTRHLTLTMVCKYHEAIFIIFFPWTGSQSKGLISEQYRKMSMELCVKSAQAVLAIAARISSCDILGG
ncbi:hypothetical protein BJY04DRAFT_205251 [Aspergillus karnatakaensis]|uniref:fungal specific transcription factor domain-containing protein n=1 Tax=Aspergillus karnatakaensis TaxID=1810916 RepID=UPI003CCD22FF